MARGFLSFLLHKRDKSGTRAKDTPTSTAQESTTRLFRSRTGRPTVDDVTDDGTLDSPRISTRDLPNLDSQPRYDQPPIRHVSTSAVQDAVTMISIPDQSFAGSIHDTGPSNAYSYPGATPYPRTARTLRDVSPDSAYSSRTADRQVRPSRSYEHHSRNYDNRSIAPSLGFSRSAVWVPRPGSPVTVGGIRVRVDDSHSQQSGSSHYSNSTRGRSHDDLRLYQDPPRPDSRASRRSRDTEPRSRREQSVASQRSHSQRENCDCSSCIRYGPDDKPRRPYVTFENGKLVVHVDEGSRVHVGNPIDGYLPYNEYNALQRQRSAVAPVQQQPIYAVMTVPPGVPQVYGQPTQLYALSPVVYSGNTQAFVPASVQPISTVSAPA